MRAAVIDLGSNSGRVLVYDVHPGGYIEVVEEARAPLRLVRDLDESGALSPAALRRTIEAVGDFAALARAAGAERIEAVGTSTLREATNTAQLARMILEAHHVRLEVLSGADEARFAFIGAAAGLPVEHGLVIDIGGGSVELLAFHDREPGRSWTLPLGALRLADGWLGSDPPAATELEALREHIRAALAEVDLGPERAGSVVGTGGAIRNLARIDRKQRRYPVARLHGYELSRRRLRRATVRLAALTSAEREAVAGLNPDRADTIVAAAVCLEELLGAVRAKSITVSGQGLREGIGRGVLVDRLPGPREVREASVQAIGARFSRWNAERARHRSATACALLDVCAPPPELREALAHATMLLGTGAAVDPYNNPDRAADIVVVTDLLGFTHRSLALMHAMLRMHDRAQLNVASLRPLLTAEDQLRVARAGAALLVADEVHRRLPSGVQPAVVTDDGEAAVRLSARPHAVRCPPHAVARFEAAFGLRLLLDGGGD